MIYKKVYNVLGTKYKIKFVDLLSNNLCGLCDREKKIIYIEKSLLENELDFYTTLLHELGHAVAFEASLHQGGLAHEIEEIWTDLNSKIFYKEVLKPIIDKLPEDYVGES